MNTRLLALFLTATVSLSFARAETGKTFKDEKEKANYAIGLSVGGNFKQGNLEYDAAAFEQGMKDALGDKPGLSPQEISEVIRKYQSERRAVLGEKNKAEGEAFLAENKTKPGVKTFASGLQYKVLAEGSGDSPKPEDSCVVKYRGTLINGTEFDSSERQHNGTATFPANRVIKGWTEALTHMKPGAKWQLFIPPDLAYGEHGNRNIGPNSVLLFDVELVSFSPPPPPAKPAAPLTSDIIKVPSLEDMKKGAKIETIKPEDVEKLQKEKEKKN
ncbi:MAG TPA: FKBP-type peptidyl-prolyl cis-trans isomerase [Verrucomicrobiota bacterium]|nr:FKBP-type peptidyl-prolyl cis-trans isomerase [Verrucomicrobiota bacterium]HNT14502.1 FKBP-type peptidyl-prolyl cis-trans isomerase [Verrucomicrobiota bacterium]